LADLRSAGVTITEIELHPLEVCDATSMLSEALGMGQERVRPLAELLLKKTGGNPFFLRHFLSALYRDGALFFDDVSRVWTWTTSAIESSAVTENVADFLLAELERLPEATR